LFFFWSISLELSFLFSIFVPCNRGNRRIMKKIYVAPSAETLWVGLAMMIAASDSVNSNVMDDVPYGGVDEDGTVPPSCRGFLL
jgi:hypothetical protein